MYLFDTNVLSELSNRRPDQAVHDRFFATDPATRLASSVTLQELRYGAAIHPQPERVWTKVEREILPWVRWLDFDAGAALRAGMLQASLERAGRIIGAEDMQIAATALQHGLTLGTRNTRHFERVQGLKIENWFEAAHQ